jgi:hypothetical protein
MLAPLFWNLKVDNSGLSYLVLYKFVATLPADT